MMPLRFLSLVLLTIVLHPVQSVAQDLDANRFLNDIQVLAADEMQGRLVGTAGGLKAQAYVLERYKEIGLQPWLGEYSHPFRFTHRDGRPITNAANILGVVEGTRKDGRYIVVTAHFDHVGMSDGEIYNGSDDNASGVAGLLAAASWFQANPAPTGIIFAALDAEEGGLRGAQALVSKMDSLGVLESVVLNINMDMISISEAGELYAVGTYHYPFLKPVIETVAAQSNLKLLMGHDRPDLKPGDDWTNSSDHAAFHRRGIPFIYFGVEDHPYYHTPQDTFDKITADFAVEAGRTVIRAIEAFAQQDRIGEK
jgi:Zn-dependent M28 family amino/carboxypeptidase